jgi:hypothetical protein
LREVSAEEMILLEEMTLLEETTTLVLGVKVTV